MPLSAVLGFGYGAGGTLVRLARSGVLHRVLLLSPEAAVVAQGRQGHVLCARGTETLLPRAVALHAISPAPDAPNRAEFEALSSAAEALSRAHAPTLTLRHFMNHENARLRPVLLNYASNVWDAALRLEVRDGTIAICASGVFLAAAARYAALALGAQPDSLIREAAVDGRGFVLEAPAGGPAPDAGGRTWTARLVAEVDLAGIFGSSRAGG